MIEYGPFVPPPVIVRKSPGNIARDLAPSLVTLLGLAVGMHGLWLGNVWICLASLPFDFIDGWLARKLHRVTTIGARLDYAVDSVLAVALVFRFFWLRESLIAAVLLVLAQTFGTHAKPRFSGRTLVTAFVAWQAFWPSIAQTLK